MDIEQHEIICGIYKVTNNLNGKAYIGQSIDIYGRWHQHIINKNKKYLDYAFVCALRKYGEDNFTWEILEQCPQEALNEREIYYIDKYHTFADGKQGYGYNMTLGGDGQVGVGVKVSKYDLNGNFISSYNSISMAAIENGVPLSSITNCCHKRRKSCGGFMWSLIDGAAPKPYCHKGFRKVKQYTMDGNFVREFNSVTEAANSVGRTKGQISMCCRGKTPSCGGYKWQYS